MVSLDILDVGLWMGPNVSTEQCEPGLIFWLIEELLDSQTIDGCRKVFDYLESRRERTTKVCACLAVSDDMTDDVTDAVVETFQAKKLDHLAVLQRAPSKTVAC